MSAPTHTTEDWITKEEAAKMLGVSTRQVERLAARGLIKRRYTKPGKGNRYGKTEVNGGTVLEMTRDRKAALGATTDSSTSVAVVPVARSQGGDLMRQWVDATAALNRISEARQQPRAWLTLDEAVAYSGLAESAIVSLVKAGNIDAVDALGQAVGTGTRRASYRIKRASLDEYGKVGI